MEVATSDGPSQIPNPSLQQRGGKFVITPCVCQAVVCVILHFSLEKGKFIVNRMYIFDQMLCDFSLKLLVQFLVKSGVLVDQ